MADYRDWCNVCNAEINFGSHEAGCPVPAQIAAARKEYEWKKQKAQEAAEVPFKAMENEELFADLFQLENDSSVVRKELDQLEEKIRAIHRVMMDKELTWKYLDWKRANREAS